MNPLTAIMNLTSLIQKWTSCLLEKWTLQMSYGNAPSIYHRTMDQAFIIGKWIKCVLIEELK